MAINKRFFYLALLFVQILFGINFATSKIVALSMPAEEFAIIRFGIAGFILLFFSSIFYRTTWKFTWGYFLKLNIFSLLGFSLAQIFFLSGITKTSTINTSIICSLIPILTIVFVTTLRIEPFSKLKLFGVSIAFLGVLMLRGLSEYKISNTTLVGDLLIFFSAFSTALFLSSSRKFFKDHHPWWTSTWIFLISAFQLGIFALINQTPFYLPSYDPVLYGSLLFTIIGATLMTYFLTNWALAYIHASRVSIFIYLQPIVATIIAWSMLGETIRQRTIISSILILAGFLIAMKSKKPLTIKSGH